MTKSAQLFKVCKDNYHLVIVVPRLLPPPPHKQKEHKQSYSFLHTTRAVCTWQATRKLQTQTACSHRSKQFLTFSKLLKNLHVMQLLLKYLHVCLRLVFNYNFCYKSSMLVWHLKNCLETVCGQSYCFVNFCCLKFLFK